MTTNTSIEVIIRIPDQDYAHGISQGGLKLDQQLVGRDGRINAELLGQQLAIAASRLAQHFNQRQGK